MKILVTGHKGFIGGHFFEMFKEKHELAGFDKKDGDDLAIKAPDLSGYDAVINFAAETFVDLFISGPRWLIDSNVIGVFNILQQARKVNLKKFIQISTDEVYGSLPDLEFATTEYPLKSWQSLFGDQSLR